MKLLESYSRSTSVPISHKPKIYDKFFPLDIDNYITIQSKSGMPAKDYSYIQEIVDILLPILNKKNIKIIHLGQDCQPLNGAVNLIGQTSVGQCYYLLKKSKLHISVDSWMAHAACSENVPCVALYGSTTIANHSPYHFNPETSIFLESHRNGNKATFAREENPKTVDLIMPEEVANSALKLLKIEELYLFKTKFIGKSYNNKLVENAMDCVVNLQSIGIPSIVCRMDYNFNLGNLIEQIKVGKVAILTDKPIPLNLLQQFKYNIIEIIYEIKENNVPGFCREIQASKIPYRLFTRLPVDKLNNIKLNYLDYQIINKVDESFPEDIKPLPIDNLYIKGGKFVVSSRGVFNSYWGYKNNLTVEGFQAPPQKFTGKSINELNQDLDYIYLLNK